MGVLLLQRSAQLLVFRRQGGCTPLDELMQSKHLADQLGHGAQQLQIVAQRPFARAQPVHAQHPRHAPLHADGQGDVRHGLGRQAAAVYRPGQVPRLVVDVLHDQGL
ncbi:hypothetical protein RZS08_65725, partial [Arthrospira platensis SPKY1]|nr:hypothetical protein [Arthrospira platensis SPKY1]